MPLRDVNGSDQRFRFDIQWPEWFPDDKVGINVQSTAGFVSLCGMKHVTIRNVRSSGENVSIGSSVVNTDGSLTASSIQTQAPSMFDTRITRPRYLPLYTNSQWSESELLVNLEAMKNNVMSKGPVREPSAWANQLDMTLRHGFRNIGTRHLLTEVSMRQRLCAVVFGNSNVFFQASRLISELPTHTPLSFTLDALKSLGIHAVIMNGVNTATAGIENSREGSGHRLSLFPGIEWERAAWLQVATRIRGTIGKEIQD